MTEPFYANLVPINESLSLLVDFELDEKQRDELVDLIRSMYHHRIIDQILLILPLEHHEELIMRISESPDSPSTIEFLRSYIPNVEDYISQAGQRLHQELTGLIILSKKDKEARKEKDV